MKSWRSILGAFASFLIALPAAAQDPQGNWEGVLKFPNGGQNQVVFHIQKAADSQYTGSVDNPDQGLSGIPLGSIVADGKSLVFDVPSIRGAYRGVWDEAQAQWKGEWQQASARLALDLVRSGETPQGPFAGLDGDWDGLLEVGAARLRLVLHVRVAESRTTMTLDSVDQAVQGIPVSALRRDGANVRIDLRKIGAAFSGTLDADGRVLTGRWAQGGQSFPLAFNRRQPRPQTPVKPYPYREEEVLYENPAAKIRLAGTLTIPSGPGPFPTILLIAGSGALDRDEAVSGHKPFLVLADQLTRQGLAVLRVDKRGIGKSTGDYANATTGDFASDVEAGIAFLRSRPEIDGRKIGLIGHSEGGMIAPMVASRDPAVAFVVLLAGPGLRGDEIIISQMVKAAPADWSSERIERYSALMRRVFGVIISAPSSSEAAARAREILQTAGDIHGLSETGIENTIRLWTSDWYRFFLAYDPVPALKSLKGPVLAINGAKDTQVEAKPNLAAIRQALADNRDVEIFELPGLNHLFQTAEAGRVTEYEIIEETFAPVALELISKWIIARAK